MLKNTKFLYAVIAVLLAVCILCGIHIAKDRSMMYENRYFMLYYTGSSIDASSAYAKQTLSYAPGTDDFESSLAWTRNSLESVSDKIEVLFLYYPHTYNFITESRDFTSYSPSNLLYPFGIDQAFSNLVYEAEMIITYYEENNSIKDEHILWLKTLSSAADDLIEKLYEENDEGKLELKEQYYKKDKIFCIALSDFINEMYAVSIR